MLSNVLAHENSAEYSCAGLQAASASCEINEAASFPSDTLIIQAVE